MKTTRTTLLLSVLGVQFLATYLITATVKVPLPWLRLPERTFVFGLQPDGIACDYFGRLGLSLLVGALSAGLLWPVLMRLSDLSAAKWISRTFWWSVTLLVMAAGFQGVILLHRLPQPLPVPENCNER